MKFNALSIVLGAVLASACGTANKPADQAAPSASLPAAAVVRIPVSADGKEDTSKAEMRVQNNGAVAQNQADVVNAFEQGKKTDVASSNSELDQKSSSQAWCYGGYGYGYGYYPSYYYAGSYYSYGYRSYYNYGGYRYYYYWH